MDKAEELRSILRKLPDIYRSGDIEGYLAYYSPDFSANYSGLVMNSDEARKFLRSLFEGKGKTLNFQVGEFHTQFNESNDAAVISYPWREKFLFGDGRQTDTEYYEMFGFGAVVSGKLPTFIKARLKSTIFPIDSR